MSFGNTLRKIEGRVKIDFLANELENDVRISKTSRGGAETDAFAPLWHEYISNDFVTDENRIAFVVDEQRLSENPNIEYCRLDHGYRVLGADSKSGWYGNEHSGADGTLSNTYVTIGFQFPCEITEYEIRGCLGEYPLETTLAFCDKNGKEIKLIDCNYNEQNNPDPMIQKYKFEWDGSTVPFNYIKIKIKKWSDSHKLAKLSRVYCPLITAYPGSQIKSMDILEEKTGDADKLSYGISSNYCEVRVLNEKQKYLEKKNYDLLRKNRSVEPFVECGGVEYPLGKFFSEEWKVESDNQFFSCKAYDALYGLKSKEILYPMEGGSIGPDGQINTPYHIDGYGTKDGISLYSIIVKLFKLINQSMSEQGVMKSSYTYWVDNRLRNIKVPRALIETKSAWDVLQDIANAGCCYVYCDRAGEIYFQCDDFGNADDSAAYVRPAAGGGEETQPMTAAEDILISPSNTFSYNLPSINKMIVNKASVGFYSAEQDTEENKATEIDIKNCAVTKLADDKYQLQFAVDLRTVFDEIVKIEIWKKDTEPREYFRDITDLKVAFDRMYVTVNVPTIDGLTKLSIHVNEDKPGYVYETFTASAADAESIQVYGEQPYEHESNMLIDEKRAKEIADNIVAKYKNGLSYIDAEWKGDAALEPGEVFQSYDMREKRLAKEEERAPQPIAYECLSNEISFDGGFRQKTKARQSRTSVTESIT